MSEEPGKRVILMSSGPRPALLTEFDPAGIAEDYKKSMKPEDWNLFSRMYDFNPEN